MPIRRGQVKPIMVHGTKHTEEGYGEYPTICIKGGKHLGYIYLHIYA